MPRGDHSGGCCGKPDQICKRLGEPRHNQKKGSGPPQPKHPTLVARIEGWEKVKHPLDAKRRHDGEGNTYHKPGSQRKGNR